ncbi:MAG TPA: DNA-binding protein [Planctomycetaceae bacterium]|nr:DNA-binding protein [Planctomycetaceae bacterium]
MSQASTTPSGGPSPSETPEVLTLSEAADYLRVTESEVIELTVKQSLPGRKIGEQWRFLRSGLADWLLEPSPSQRLLRHAGALPDAPDAMLKQIYKDRGRSMTEDES